MIDRQRHIFNTAVNILAVEFLIKTDQKQVYECLISLLRMRQEDVGLETLGIYLELNMHIGNLGEMVSQGDYEYQKDLLMEFLDSAYEECSK